MVGKWDKELEELRQLEFRKKRSGDIENIKKLISEVGVTEIYKYLEEKDIYDFDRIEICKYGTINIYFEDGEYHTLK